MTGAARFESWGGEKEKGRKILPRTRNDRAKACPGKPWARPALPAQKGEGGGAGVEGEGGQKGRDGMRHWGHEREKKGS